MPRDFLSLLPTDKQLEIANGNAVGRSLRRPSTDTLGYDIETGVFNGEGLDPATCPAFILAEEIPESVWVSHDQSIPYFQGFDADWDEGNPLLPKGLTETGWIDAARAQQAPSTASIDPIVRKRRTGVEQQGESRT